MKLLELLVDLILSYRAEVLGLLQTAGLEVMDNLREVPQS